MSKSTLVLRAASSLTVIEASNGEAGAAKAKSNCPHLTPDER